MNIQVKKLHEDAVLPKQHTTGAAGADLCALTEGGVWPKESAHIRTGIALAIPQGYVGIVKSRSGLAFRHNIEVGAGVIDCDYRGEINILLHNHSKEGIPFKYAAGDRVAQLLILPVSCRLLLKKCWNWTVPKEAVMVWEVQAFERPQTDDKLRRPKRRPRQTKMGSSTPRST